MMPMRYRSRTVVRKLAKELAEPTPMRRGCGVRAVHEVWSKGVSVPARPAGAARPVSLVSHVAIEGKTRSPAI